MTYGIRPVRFPEVLTELMKERFAGNRAKLAEQLGISASALSQYARGKATPSMNVMVDLAHALNVSLDFLVYGVQADASSDSSMWISHFEGTFRKMSSQSDAVRQSVNRVGLMLANEIESAVTKTVRDQGVSGGTLTALEVVQVEQFSVSTRMATTDLELDVTIPAEAGTANLVSDKAVAPGPFLDVIVGNIIAGREYNYIVPNGPRWRDRARLLRSKVVEELTARNSAAVHSIGKYLNFWTSDIGLVPSYVLYTIDIATMEMRDPVRFDLLQSDVLRGQDPSFGTLALLEPPTPRSSLYYIVGVERVEILVNEHARTLHQSKRLEF